MDINRPKASVMRALRTNFKYGTIVELVYMDDKNAPPVGTRGKVIYVDDIGTIFVDWDTGSTLGVVYGKDRCKIVRRVES